jgi:hypothetical protein
MLLFGKPKCLAAMGLVILARSVVWPTAEVSDRWDWLKVLLMKGENSAAGAAAVIFAPA